MTYSTSIDDISNQSANLWPYRQSSPSEQALLKQPWTCTVDGLLSPDEQTHSRPQGPIHTTDLKHTPGDQSIAPNPPNEQLNTNEREEQPPMTENRLVPIAHVVYRPYDDPVDTEHKTRKAITKAKLMRIIDDLFLRTILNSPVEIFINAEFVIMRRLGGIGLSLIFASMWNIGPSCASEGRAVMVESVPQGSSPRSAFLLIRRAILLCVIGVSKPVFYTYIKLMIELRNQWCRGYSQEP
ncbi:hypothetical protein FRC19_003899 [Serendipita sp. 401]|nr:hypothetical protein FRC19_003899 [Serendipita sp. 401]KAG9058568.1 hypothetical protein FS842_007990 [Serendipita sp. 407]